MQNYMERRIQLVNAITAHIPRIKQEIHDVLSIINTNEKAGNAMPDNVDNERLNRLWLHGLHEDKIFNDRLSFFLVFESILLGVVGMLYSAPNPKTIVLLAIMILGLVITVVWGLVQIQQKRSLDVIKARVKELDPDYRKTVEIRHKVQMRFSIIWIFTYFIPD